MYTSKHIYPEFYCDHLFIAVAEADGQAECFQVAKDFKKIRCGSNITFIIICDQKDVIKNRRKRPSKRVLPMP